ncbi:putative uncharacterized protein [Wolbachia endosymbiont of Cimex lectularius]|nr:putative uncharacterized protein [Wolbachia endosymbiont of Cimex lectularius]
MVKLMADSKISITFSDEISECLVGLAEIRNKSVKELAEKLMEEAIENEEDRILIERAAKLHTPDAKTIDFEDVKWDQ